ncbi:MAG: hypothetical protein AAGU17_03365 [Anaerolineaceae bacterium]
MGKASQRKQSLVSTQPAPNTDYGNPAPTQQASDSAIMVGMTASRFTPDALTIKVGTPSPGRMNPRSSTRSPAIPSASTPAMGEGDTFRYIFTSAEAYTYHCIS